MSRPDSVDIEVDQQFLEFQYVLEQELQSIRERRMIHERPNSAWPAIDLSKAGAARRPIYDVFGVALSGGGIRSAAFCLGALQSLNVRKLFRQVDYLSTVSGGGYIGSSISAAMSEPISGAAAHFPFCDKGQMDDSPALVHLRDYSNYIVPRGRPSLRDAITIVLRGLATNLVFVLAFVFLFAGFTLAAYPTTKSLTAGSFLSQLPPFAWALSGVGNYPFALTIWLSVLLTFGLACWALLHSQRQNLSDDIHGAPIVVGRWVLLILLVNVVLDLQPLAIWLLVWIKQNGWSELVKTITVATAPFAAIASFFSGRLATFLKGSTQSAKPGTIAARISSIAVLWIAALLVPFGLYLFFLWVCASGMPDSGFQFPSIVDAFFRFLAGHLFGSLALAFLATGFFLLALTWAFKPNANSLHQLYRSKLSKAFLFNPDERCPAGTVDQDDLVPRNALKLSDLVNPMGGAYHLINAAVNLQGSVRANRRGRNANFFLFSPKYIGSTVTGYAETKALEACDPHINLGTAMAISGAAVSSEMGSLKALRPLAPTLALLNLRLGYWMPNPIYIQYPDLPGRRVRRLSRLFGGYLYSEMFGRLNETSANIYVTDGGHIENLGLYELLKRHCKVVLVVDGEADPQMTFQTLAACERYARIDLGVRITLPWQPIAEAGNAATERVQEGKPISATTPGSKGGPHCAVGTIYYPGGEKGILIYVKASVTGDEPDYVLDYKKRNPAFPHESTGDQFFSEEQFEAYRALGFHAMDGFWTNSRSYTASTDVLAEGSGYNSVADHVKAQLPL